MGCLNWIDQFKLKKVGIAKLQSGEESHIQRTRRGRQMVMGSHILCLLLLRMYCPGKGQCQFKTPAGHLWLVTQSGRLFVTPGTVAPRLLCPWEFFRREYWSGLPCPLSGNHSNPGIEPRSPALQVDSLLSKLPGKLAEQ